MFICAKYKVYFYRFLWAWINLRYGIEVHVVSSQSPFAILYTLRANKVITFTIIASKNGLKFVGCIIKFQIDQRLIRAFIYSMMKNILSFQMIWTGNLPLINNILFDLLLLLKLVTSVKDECYILYLSRCSPEKKYHRFITYWSITPTTKAKTRIHYHHQQHRRKKIHIIR